MANAVGFDFDHTLGIDNKLERVAFIEVAQQIAASARRNIDDAAASVAIDGELARFRSGRCGLQEALQAAFVSVLGAAPPEAEKLFRDRAVSLVPQYVEVMPGVPELLAQLNAARVQYAILTNGWNPLQQRKAEHIGFDRPVLVSEDLGVRKPEREAFFALANVLDAVPRQIVYVGDDPMVDIAGALAAGMRAIWFCWEVRDYPDGIPPPTAIVQRITDVPNYLA